MRLMSKRLYFTALLCISCHLCLGQSIRDSLSFKDYLQYVLRYHPVAMQANTLPDYARAQLRATRGAFDPIIQTASDTKQYDTKNYYRYWDAQLKIPVWIGPDIKVGYEKNTGYYLSDENSTPNDGLVYAGISWPVGRGLWMDERRSVLLQAKQMLDMNDAEKVNVINKLILEAAKDFRAWEMAYYRLRQFDIALELAQVRFTAVKQRVEGGDEAAIDSVEAKIFLFDRRNQRLQAFLEFQNAILKLNTYLWAEGQVPVNIDTTIIPAKDDFAYRAPENLQLNQLLVIAETNHPKLRQLQSKINIYNIEQSLLRNQLLPAINLNYNFINTPADFSFSRSFETAFNNNYKFGFSFYYPLLLRKERGKLRMNDLKIFQTKQELEQTERMILNEVRSVFNEYVTLSSQLSLQAQQVEFTNVLLNGERDKFFNGESTLFLVNTREVSMINAELKLIELRYKAAVSLSTLYWSAGLSLLE